MRTIFALLGLLGLMSLSPAQAAHFPPSAIIKVCSFDSDHDRANCDAFLRGSLERFQAAAVEGKVRCRREAFGPGDVKDFQQFAAASTIPDSGEAIALTFNFWASRPDKIPCSDVAGFWTNGHLLQLCSADNSGGSSCKFYVTALMAATQIEEVLRKTQYFCPKGSPIRSDEEALDNFRSWVEADPSRANAPAALGYVDAMIAAFPC